MLYQQRVEKGRKSLKFRGSDKLLTRSSLLFYLLIMLEGRGRPLRACGARRAEGCLNPDGLGIAPVLVLGTCFETSGQFSEFS